MIESVLWRVMEKAAWTNRQEESLGGTRLEELLPLLCIVLGESDGIDGEVEFHLNHLGPGPQLRKSHRGKRNTLPSHLKKNNNFDVMCSHVNAFQSNVKMQNTQNTQARQICRASGQHTHSISEAVL